MEELKQKYKEYKKYVDDFLEATTMPEHLQDISRKKMLTFNSFMNWLD